MEWVRNIWNKCAFNPHLHHDEYRKFTFLQDTFSQNSLNNALRLSSLGFAYLGVLIDGCFLRGSPNRWNTINPLKALFRAALFILYGAIFVLPLYFIPPPVHIGIFTVFARIAPGFLFLTFLMSFGKFGFLILGI